MVHFSSIYLFIINFMYHIFHHSTRLRLRFPFIIHPIKQFSCASIRIFLQLSHFISVTRPSSRTTIFTSFFLLCFTNYPIHHISHPSPDARTQQGCVNLPYSYGIQTWLTDIIQDPNTTHDWIMLRLEDTKDTHFTYSLVQQWVLYTTSLYTHSYSTKQHNCQ